MLFVGLDRACARAYEPIPGCHGADAVIAVVAVIAVIAVVQGSPTASVLEADVLRLTVANDRLVALREGRDQELLVAQERIQALETQLAAALRELEDLRRALATPAAAAAL